MPPGILGGLPVKLGDAVAWTLELNKELKAAGYEV